MISVKPDKASCTGTGPVTNPATVEDTEHGTVTVSSTDAAENSKVTVTAIPDEGYELASLVVTDKNGKDVEVTDAGDGKYTFRMPDSKVTITATFVQEGSLPAELPFTDVDDGMYYAAPIAWAAGNGIVNGFPDGTFGPEDSVTREQMSAILYRYAGYKGFDVAAAADLSVCTDAGDIGSYAIEAMAWANASGLITGDAGMLNPQGSATRAQVATILMRFVENLSK